MTLLGILGWVVAIAFGLGWWIEHRGIAGIKSDLADAKAQADKIRAKV